MVNADKNADRHVMDQNVDRISREIAYVPLGERIRPKRSSYMQPFSFIVIVIIYYLFFGKKKMSTRHAYQWSRQNKDFSRDLKLWTCFPKVQWI